MIHIKTSSIPNIGIGLFTKQDIKKGDLIYTPNPNLDVDLTQEQFDNLIPEEQQEVLYYGYFHEKSQKYHVAFDAIRILNHADGENANVTQDEDMIMTAKRDINAGEEIFQDYIEIYPSGSFHFDRINNR